MPPIHNPHHKKQAHSRICPRLAQPLFISYPSLSRPSPPVSPASLHIATGTNKSPVLYVGTKYAQELLSTFSVSLGEVALQPATGGVFVVEITTAAGPASNSNNNNAGTTLPAADSPSSANAAIPTAPNPPAAVAAKTGAAAGGDGGDAQTRVVVLWDRKTDGGFPETKELKRRVRDVIQPGRDLGHVDRVYPTRSGGDGRGGNGAEGGVDRQEEAAEVKARAAEKEREGGEKGETEGEGGEKRETGRAGGEKGETEEDLEREKVEREEEAAEVKARAAEKAREGRACSVDEGAQTCEDCE